MSNTLVPQNNNIGVDVKTIPSYEVAEMMDGKQHWQVLRMLDGYEPPKGSKSRKVVGIIPTLTNHNVVVSEYFIESTYKDGSGKQNKYYECTKMGCDMLANKMTGEKGILFTAKYVKRFKEMQQQIEQQMVSADQIKQMIDEAVKAAVAPIMDRLEKLTAPKEAPKTKENKIKTPYSVSKIAKLANMSRNDVNPTLRDQKIISGNTRTGWVLNKEYEEAGWGITNENGGQYNGSFVMYSKKGKDAILKILNRVNEQEQLNLF